MYSTEHVFTSKQAEANSGGDISEALTQQMEEHRKEHQKHLNSLRDELAAKQEVIDGLKEYVTLYHDRCVVEALSFSLMPSCSQNDSKHVT